MENYEKTRRAFLQQMEAVTPGPSKDVDHADEVARLKRRIRIMEEEKGELLTKPLFLHHNKHVNVGAIRILKRFL